MADDLVVLRSPFTGGTVWVPPDLAIELCKRGFWRDADAPPAGSVDVPPTAKPKAKAAHV